MTEFDSVNNNTDCLVLKITEKSYSFNSGSTTDNIIYVFFDVNENVYHLRGKRHDIKLTEGYSFCCDNECNVSDFIDFIVPKNNTVMYDVLNYKKLPVSSHDVTYDYLELNYSSKNEIVAYHSEKLKKNRLKKALRILAQTYNYY
jgi:hypothetical protein